MTEPPTAAKPRPSATAEAFLDAAERLLVEVGHAGISTRRLAAEAGANQGLVHYYFGSMDELFVQVLERFTERLVARQREMYGADAPFIEKWRTAWRFQEEDLEAGYSKIWMELQALSWSQPDLRPRDRAGERRVARGAPRRVRGRGEGVRPRRRGVPGRGARRDDHDLRPGLRARAPGGDRRGARASCSTGSSAGSSHSRRGGRHDRCRGGTDTGRARAEPRPLPGRGGLHRARRRARVLGVLRRGRADDPLPARPGRSCTRASGRRRSRYFARHFRVVCFDPRGNGRSDRPQEPAAYAEREFAQDAIDVMDACGVDRAICVALSTRRAARAPARGRASRARRRHGLHRPLVPGQPAALAPLAHAAPPAHGAGSRTGRRSRRAAGASSTRTTGRTAATPTSSSGGPRRMLPEPHSTKQIEDAIAWSHDTDGATLGADRHGRDWRRPPPAATRSSSRSASAARCS